MARKNNNKRKDDHLLGPIITVLKDGFLGGLLLIAISHGVHVLSQARVNETNAQREVLNQFAMTKVTLDQQIDLCLNGEKLTKSDYQRRLNDRKKLVALVAKNKLYLPPNAFFNLAQYTRFDDAQKFQNLCNSSESDLLYLRNHIKKIDIEIQNRLEK